MEENLYCNIARCKMLLSDSAIVTRCFHVFCLDHGKAYFSNTLQQINCPVCNEVIVKEMDVIQCELNPNDLILGGLAPERIIGAVINSVKLRKRQQREKHEYNMAQIDFLNTKLNTAKKDYKKMVKEITAKYDEELKALKCRYEELMRKMKDMSRELGNAKNAHKRYEVAYNSYFVSNDAPVENIFAKPSPDSPLGFQLFGNIASPSFCSKSSSHMAILTQCIMGALDDALFSSSKL